MHSNTRSHASIFGMSWSPANAALTILLTLLFLIFLFLFLTLTAQPAQGQTYRVIHNFTGRSDGGSPAAGLTMDQNGNLYGTTLTGGHIGICGLRRPIGCGTVFKLSKRDSGWVLTPLHDFQGGNDGAGPWARVIFGPDGNLYGTTSAGGDLAEGCISNDDLGCGTVFKLSPPSRTPPNTLNSWTETVLHRFNGTDGAGPGFGDLVFDRAGNVYGNYRWGWWLG